MEDKVQLLEAIMNNSEWKSCITLEEEAEHCLEPEASLEYKLVNSMAQKYKQDIVSRKQNLLY